MKHIFSILLALILLCSCTVSTDSNPYSDMPVPTDAEDRFMENSPTDGIIQEDSEQESSVIREYHETVMGDPSDVHLSTQLVGNRIAYIKKNLRMRTTRLRLSPFLMNTAIRSRNIHCRRPRTSGQPKKL